MVNDSSPDARSVKCRVGTPSIIVEGTYRTLLIFYIPGIVSLTVSRFLQD